MVWRQKIVFSVVHHFGLSVSRRSNLLRQLCLEPLAQGALAVATLEDKRLLDQPCLKRVRVFAEERTTGLTVQIVVPQLGVTSSAMVHHIVEASGEAAVKTDPPSEISETLCNCSRQRFDFGEIEPAMFTPLKGVFRIVNHCFGRSGETDHSRLLPTLVAEGLPFEHGVVRSVNRHLLTF